MQTHPNPTSAFDLPVEGLVRTLYALIVCPGCGHERIHQPVPDISCPECGANAWRSFALFRDLREDPR